MVMASNTERGRRRALPPFGEASHELAIGAVISSFIFFIAATGPFLDPLRTIADRDPPPLSGMSVEPRRLRRRHQLGRDVMFSRAIYGSHIVDSSFPLRALCSGPLLGRLSAYSR